MTDNHARNAADIRAVRTSVAMQTVSHIQGPSALGELTDAGGVEQPGCGPQQTGRRCANVGIARLAHLLATYTGASHRLGAYVLHDDAGRLGLMPYLLQQYPLPCRIGDVRLFSAPLRRIRLLHEAGYWPDSPAAYRRLLDRIATTTAGRSGNGTAGPVVDVVCAFSVPVGSGLADFLATQAIADRRFRVYRPTPAVLHHRIRLPDTFQAYLAGLTAKSRTTLRRKVRKLLGQTDPLGSSGSHLLEAAVVNNRAAGIVRVTRAEDVPWLVQRMTDLSRKTYQYNLLGLGVRDPEQLARDAKAAARRGWLRSYVLLVNGQAVAFMHGLQFPGQIPGASRGGSYDYIDVGHDPAWSSQSPGTVLQYLVIEDLYRHDPPAVFDFGPGDAVHKARFGNASCLETDFYLFRRTARALWAHGAHSACTRTSAWAGAVLDRFRLKAKVRHAVRRLASAP